MSLLTITLCSWMLPETVALHILSEEGAAGLHTAPNSNVSRMGEEELADADEPCWTCPLIWRAVLRKCIPSKTSDNRITIGEARTCESPKTSAWNKAFRKAAGKRSILDGSEFDKVCKTMLSPYKAKAGSHNNACGGGHLKPGEILDAFGEAIGAPDRCDDIMHKVWHKCDKNKKGTLSWKEFYNCFPSSPRSVYNGMGGRDGFLNTLEFRRVCKTHFDTLDRYLPADLK